MFCLLQGKKAQQALAQCLADIRTQDPQAQHTSSTVPKTFVQVHPSIVMHSPTRSKLW